jgi:hypothetical protein
MSVAESRVIKDVLDIGHLPSVTAALRYIEPTNHKPRAYMYEPPAGEPKIDATFEPHQVTLRNLRPIASRLSLETEGFVLRRHESCVRAFYSDDEVRDIHYEEVAELITYVTGASRVFVFDHTVRRRYADDSVDPTRPRREPVPRVHVDYTLKSGPQRVRDLMGNEADDLLQRRFSIINVWRPIRGPLEDAPLALCDARSVSPEDLVATDLLYTDRVGETYNVRHNIAHRWFYAPRMRPDEVLMFRCYDSMNDGRARFVPHAAFDDPTAPRNVIPRESIELRALVFY